LDDAAKKKTPFIYVQDSMDVLDEEADIETFESRKDAHRKGTKAKGSYGMAKAKTNSMGIRRVLSHLRKTGSILIIISQTRDKVQSFGGVPGAKSRAGGHALKFYASTEIWFSVKKTLTKTIKGKSRQLGILSKVKVQRSRITGKSKTVDVPIYHSQGVDDVGACVDYLVEERHWKKTGGEENMDAGKITAPEFSTVALPREKLIQTIEGENREQELRSLVRSVWNEIESACEIKRKSRYK
jgi:RecA/RadA recombinase